MRVLHYALSEKFVLRLQGVSEEVPAYRQYEGQVRNRHLGKRETTMLIKDLWKEKAIADEANVSFIRLVAR